jgi:hypothetical protein
MIIALNYLVKILASFICMLMFWLNFVIVLLMWDGKCMVVFDIMDKIWNKDE